MNSAEIAKSYDNTAHIWDDHMGNSTYGIAMVNKAISYCSSKRNALDVGCGSGGRIINILLDNNFELKAIDISKNMLALAKAKHPNVSFEEADIIAWETDEKFDLIIAWDSTFHLPINSQKPVLEKLCNSLNPKGILLYTIGDIKGEHIDTWNNEKFGYSSLGITENLNVIQNLDCECKHLELDQFPEKHVSIIVKKLF